MVEDNKRIITFSLVATALLVGFTVHLTMAFVAGVFPSVSRVTNMTEVANGVPVILGALTFLLLQFNTKTHDFLDGVVTELKKVVWPSRRDTGLMTIVVVVFLIIAGVIVGAYDVVWAYIINFIVK